MSLLADFCLGCFAQPRQARRHVPANVLPFQRWNWPGASGNRMNMRPPAAILITPRAAQLRLTTSRPRMKRTDSERDRSSSENERIRMTNIIQPKWHRPRVVVVEAWGPLRCCVLLTMFDGRRIVVPGPSPIVTNEFNGAALVIAALREIFGSDRTAKSITSKQVKQIAARNESLWLALGGKFKDPTWLNSNRISDRLIEIEGRDFDGYCLERDRAASTAFHNATVWYIAAKS